MAKEKLTKKTVDDAKPGIKTHFIWDGGLPGFGLKIEPSGKKTFVAQWRDNGGGRGSRTIRHKLGDYGKLTPDEARREAKSVLARVQQGADPAAERKKGRTASTVGELVQLYESDGLKRLRGSRKGEPLGDLTIKQTMARIHQHVVPLLGNKRLIDLTEEDVEGLYKNVAAGMTARSRGKKSTERPGRVPGAGRSAVKDLSLLLSFARHKKLMASNPIEAAAVPRKDGQRERYLSKEEIQRLGEVLDRLEAEGTNRKSCNQVRLMLFTGLRRTECLKLTWDEVDVREVRLKLIKSKSKRKRPMSPNTIDLLECIRNQEKQAQGGTIKSPYVFPSDHGPTYFQGSKSLWPKLKKIMGIPELSPHTLRHTLGSHAVSNGESLEMTAALLGHANLRSTEIYAHLQDASTKEAAARVGRRIALALRPEPNSEIRLPPDVRCTDRPSDTGSTEREQLLGAIYSIIGKPDLPIASLKTVTDIIGLMGLGTAPILGTA